MTEVIRYAKRLHSRDVLGDTWLRRNSIYYNLVTYVNHTIALFIGMEYDGVVLFINRADKERERLVNTYKYNETYFKICDEYLREVARYIVANQLVSESAQKLIPERFNI